MPTYNFILEAGEGQETRSFEAEDDVEAVMYAAGLLEGQLSPGLLYESDVVRLERRGGRSIFHGTVSRFTEYATKTWEARWASRYGL